ncbi:2-keto-3-deoxy-galactonokinase [Rhodobacteraceae bacterium (ex Bugula neritina AB1)]|nr:2-keto-3-deoxy-galactonokinase [Rhodobacteraceae bacterium (ex Bugula neritina AB1)]
MMQPPDSGTSWLAANLDGNMLTAWSVTGGAATPAQVLQLPDNSPAALAESLRQLRTGEQQPVLLGGSTLAPLQQVPAAPARLAPAPVSQGGLNIHALPGLAQSAPVGMILGATARLRGFLQLNPDWDGVVCLPGSTVTHWVQISAKEAVSFQSALTGQLAAAIAQPILLESVGGFTKTALAEAAADSVAKPELLAGRLAALQAGVSLGQIPAETARGRLWGLLLGAELAAARPYWLGQNLALVAEAPLQPLYAAALEAQGLPVTTADPLRMTLEGLRRAWSPA